MDINKLYALHIVRTHQMLFPIQADHR